MYISIQRDSLIPVVNVRKILITATGTIIFLDFDLEKIIFLCKLFAIRHIYM